MCIICMHTFHTLSVKKISTTTAVYNYQRRSQHDIITQSSTLYGQKMNVIVCFALTCQSKPCACPSVIIKNYHHISSVVYGTVCGTNIGSGEHTMLAIELNSLAYCVLRSAILI